jgi:hypothetical protein
MATMNRVDGVVSSLSQALRMTPAEWALTLRVWGLIVAGSFLQRYTSMSKWQQLLGRPHQVSPAITLHNNGLLTGFEQRLGKAILRSSSLLPWKVSCLTQAFAGQRILKSRGTPGEVVIGLKKATEGPWPAHAWLIYRGSVIAGEQPDDFYSPTTAYSFDD